MSKIKGEEEERDKKMLTEKQQSMRKVVQTLYIPLELAERIDETAEDYNISRNELINKMIVFGLDNPRAFSSAVKGVKATNPTPTPAPEDEPTPEPVGGVLSG